MFFETRKGSRGKQLDEETGKVFSQLQEMVEKKGSDIEAKEHLLGLSYGDANSSPKDSRAQMHSSTSIHTPCPEKQGINEDVVQDDIDEEFQEEDVDDEFLEDNIDDEFQEVDDVDDEFQEDDVDDEIQDDNIGDEFEVDNLDDELQDKLE
ncbi:hypothetical protein MTR_7g012300 [Medicago truncatula]|uniref:Uncharacterized protein n=1 Tax=Medicago truncatula TaxID=3880 RepID=G7L456_MEDTR|nr:hypothetical protein MTR_7g012300 [Medicago truncatula]